MTTLRPLTDFEKLAMCAVVWARTDDMTASNEIDNMAREIYKDRLFYRVAYWSLIHRLMGGQAFTLAEAVTWIADEVNRLSRAANLDIEYRVESTVILAEAL